MDGTRYRKVHNPVVDITPAQKGCACEGRRDARDRRVPLGSITARLKVVPRTRESVSMKPEAQASLRCDLLGFG